MTSPTQGHNSGVQGERLRHFISRIEKLEAERAEIQTDVAAVYEEAKSEGFQVKIMRQVVKLRSMDAAKRAEQQALVDLYMAAVGDYATTDLGQAAVPVAPEPHPLDLPPALDRRLRQ